MPTKPATGKALEIKLAHSPDSDDAFMFYGLATQKVRTPGLKFSHVLADIETLNQAASQEIYDVTAFSFAAYPYIRDKYLLLDCGGSFGEGYGPIVVSQHPLKREDLAKCRVGVPGLHTSAYLALRLYEPRVEPIPMAFEHREAAVNYAMQFARDMDSELADKFIGMYVNKWTLGYGERGRKAVREFLTRGVNAGLIPGPPDAEFLSEE